MDFLMSAFMGLEVSGVDWYNNTNYDLVCVNERVFTRQSIGSGEFIGMIDGIEKHISEVLPDKYCIWIDETTVLDCRGKPRSITAMIREGWFDGAVANCKLCYTYTSLQTLVYVETLRPIQPGEELIIYFNSIY